MAVALFIVVLICLIVAPPILPKFSDVLTKIVALAAFKSAEEFEGRLGRQDFVLPRPGDIFTLLSITYLKSTCFKL